MSKVYRLNLHFLSIIAFKTNENKKNFFVTYETAVHAAGIDKRVFFCFCLFCYVKC